MDNTNTTSITLSDNAASKINELTSKESLNKKLRISVNAGGCSGFQYQYDFVQDTNSDDIVLEKNGATVLIDNMSAEFMKNAVIDYIETLGSAEFLIKNPNASSKCGCGNSFST
ncbi:MAG: iron-sulfur cluster insertion protein ErpA [Alphaproteobacteria bacterium]|jgi:iron-sulfur cluster assembly accessory protein